MSGYLGDISLDACVIIVNIVAMAYMIPLGIGYVATNKVGNNLGANESRNAKRYANVCLLLVVGLGVIVVLMMNIFPYMFANMYTSHQDISALVVSIIPIASFFVLFDFIQCVAMAIIRAMGYQYFATYLSLFSYYAIAVPLTYICTFPLDYKEHGIWMGMPVGCFVLSAAFLAVVYRCDWQELASKVFDRIQREQQIIEGFSDNISESASDD